jgi:hypothetical protein
LQKVTSAVVASSKSEAGAVVEQTKARTDATLSVGTGNHGARLWRYLKRFEWLIMVLVLCVSACLHIRFVTHVGGLWRDETNSVNVAGLASFGEIWRSLDYDSFPILFFLVLRSWLELFGFYNDAALRALGCIIGLGVLAALWYNARAFGAHGPVLSLALVGLNPMVIRYGDSTRAYGLGILLILLTFGSFWRLVDSPSSPPTRRVWTAAVLALLSVHCLYYNSVLLLAIAAGALAVAVRARAWRKVVIVLGIGTVAAASLLPYVPMMRRMREWTFLVSFPADFPWLWKRSCEVIGSPDPLEIWLWFGLVVVGLGIVAAFAVSPLWLGFARQRMPRGDAESAPRPFLSKLRQPYPLPDAILFAAVALIVGVVGYATFLRALQYYTQPWYYIALVAFVACALDVLFGAWPIATRRRILPLLLRSVRVMVALSLLCLVSLPDWEEMPTRHTNVDLLGERLRVLAKKNDVILVPRWECAITLCRYYRGPAEVVSLPPINDHRFHRYDLVLRQIMTTDPVAPVFTKLESALGSGHHVFVAGELPFPSVLPPLPTASPVYRDPNGGWHGVPYDLLWPLRVGHFLRVHASGVSQTDLFLPARVRVQEFENLKLIVLEGWRPAP